MTEFEKIQAEKEEAKILINEGLVFNAGKREFHIKPITADVMFRANKYAVELKMNIVESDNASLFKEVDKNIIPLFRFIAICVLHDAWKIKLFTKPFARYLMTKLKSQDALKLSMAILQMYDLGNFITSIRIIGQTTITSPKASPLIDTNNEGSTASMEQ